MTTTKYASVGRTYMRPRIAVFIPAHNEEKSIRTCLEGLAEQSLPNGVDMDVFVVADNCTDQTEKVAIEAGKELGLKLHLIVTEGNKQRKVGALNAAWKKIYGDKLDIHTKEMSEYQLTYQESVKAILGMDADSELAPYALQYMWDGLMSARNIGGVMAKYTMKMPKSKRSLDKENPYYEELVASGEYGGPVARWWTHQQKQDMASWLLSLQYSGGSTYVLGGQATLFRPDALHDIVDKNNLDAPWQNDTDVEDMLLTWQLQQHNWKTLISPKARCFVDAMRTYHAFRQQRNKWSSGTVDLLTSKDLSLKTRHTGRIWRSQAKSFMELFIRLAFLLLLGTALATDQFEWHWVWLTPILIASILNIILAVKTPYSRPIDVILSGLLISPEIYLWVNLMTFGQVWIEKFQVHKKDGWANQYAAESGKTKSKLWQGILAVILGFAIIIGLAIYFRPFLTSDGVQAFVDPYLTIGWVALTLLTVYASIAMIYQIWTLRGRYKA